ncbi:ArnT family glycosyltransferase [Candidatus Magnetomonas plexicatena]|uniref:ArnT family glycosyltransferase n=1 Tax=Candidatus Magnetomonas plexicatena TaxID=2552947 RepID=UPI001104478C
MKTMPKKQAKSIIDKQWYFVAAGFVAVLISAHNYAHGHSSDVIRQHLITAIPAALAINFVLIVLGLLFNYKTIAALFTKLTKGQRYALGAVAAFALCLVVLVAPRIHRIYYDENIYLSIGQNIGFLGKAGMCNDGNNHYGVYRCDNIEFNKQPYAYPFLLSLLFKVFGSAEATGFVYNNAVFILSTMLVFLIGNLLFEDVTLSIFAALIFAMIPENIIWSNTAAVEPSAIFSPGAAMLCFLIYMKERDMKSLFLFSVMLPFSLQFRLEAILIIPVMFMYILLKDKTLLKSRRLYIFMLISLVLVMTHILQIYSVRNENWGSSGDRMALSYFWTNIKVNGLFYFNNVRFPALFTGLAMIGILGGRDFFKEKLLLLMWFVLLFGIFLFFYAGSYSYGQDVRYSLVSYMPLSILAGAGFFQIQRLFKDSGKEIKLIPLIVLFYIFISFMPHIRSLGEESWECRVDYREAQKMLIMIDKSNSIILTHNPNMFLLWGANAVQTSMATNNVGRINNLFERYSGNVYFHYNYWCNTADPVQKGFCQKILDTYDCEKVHLYTERGRTFALYKMKMK